MEGLTLLRETCTVEINPEDRPLYPGGAAEARERPRRRDLPSQRPDRRRGHGRGKGNQGLCKLRRGLRQLRRQGGDEAQDPHVQHTPGVLTDATAEMAWALLFTIARRVVETDKIMRTGTWPGWGPLQFIGGDVKGKDPGHRGGRTHRYSPWASCPRGLP